jgi:hypothetical protein
VALVGENCSVTCTVSFGSRVPNPSFGTTVTSTGNPTNANFCGRSEWFVMAREALADWMSHKKRNHTAMLRDR